MKVEGGGHYLRAVNDGAGTVYVCESKNNNFSFFTFNLIVFVKVRCYKKQGFSQINDNFSQCVLLLISIS